MQDNAASSKNNRGVNGISVRVRRAHMPASVLTALLAIGPLQVASAVADRFKRGDWNCRPCAAAREAAQCFTNANAFPLGTSGRCHY